MVRLIPAVALLACASAPARPPTPRLFVATMRGQSTVVVIARSGGARSEIPLPDRILSPEQAGARDRAYPPWVGQPDVPAEAAAARRPAGPVRVAAWPSAIAAGGGSLLAVIGDEEPSFVLQLPLNAGAPPRYFDVLERHPCSIATAGQHAFVSFLNRGVWTIELRSGAVQRIDDHYDTSIPLIRVAGDHTLPDATWQAAREELGVGPDAGGLIDGCPLLLASRDGRTVFASSATSDGAPVVLQIDVAIRRLAGGLRLADSAGAIVALLPGDGGTAWAVTRGSPGRALTAHVFDGTTGRYLRSWPPHALLAACDGTHPCIAIAHQALFVLTDAGVSVLAPPPAVRARTVALPERASGIWSSADGTTIYLAVPSRRAIASFTLAGNALVAGADIEIGGDIGAVAIEHAAGRDADGGRDATAPVHF